MARVCNSVHKLCFTHARIHSHPHFMFVVIKYAFHSPALLYTVWNTTTEQQSNKNEQKKKNRVKTWWANTTRYFVFQHFSGFLSAGILLIYELFISYLIILLYSMHTLTLTHTYMRYARIFTAQSFNSFFLYFLRAVFRSLHFLSSFCARSLSRSAPPTHARARSLVLGHMFCLFTLPIFVTVRKQ